MSENELAELQQKFKEKEKEALYYKGLAANWIHRYAYVVENIIINQFYNNMKNNDTLSH